MIDNPRIEAQGAPAVVLLSGGQDSTTCLAWAKQMFTDVRAVSFDYNQRHIVELDVAMKIAAHADVLHDILRVPALSDIGAASLTNAGIPSASNAKGTGNVYAAEHDLPSSFVPGRNVIFLSTAMAFAAPLGIYNLVTGVCEADDAGYPDCRAEFVQLMEATLRAALGDDRPTIYAPLLTLDKPRTFALAEDLGALEDVLELSHTCYEGEHTTRHSWGFGCGVCPACETRAKGWNDFQSTKAATR